MKSPFGVFSFRRFSSFFVVSALFCASGAAFSVRAADWPQWRGPNRDGISAETGWSTTWPASGPKVLWKANFGQGCSSFSVAGNRAFTMGNNQNAGAVYCLDTQTGQVVWKHEFPSPLDGKMFEGGQCSTPTVDGDSVFALGRQGQFFCLNKETGAVIWSKDFVKDFAAKPAQWGYAGSPLIVGNRVIIEVGGPGASAVAFDKASGKVLWQAGDDPQSYGSPLLFTRDGKDCVAFFNTAGLVVREAANGAELMRFPWKTMYDINPTTPIVADGKVFIASGYNHGAALVPLGEANPKALWENKAMRNKMNSCVLWKGALYGFDEGTLTCMDFATGNVKWQQKGLGLGSLTLADGKLLIQAENGALVVAEAAPEAYKEIARTQAVPNKTWVIPVLANGKIFCRNNNGEAVCLDVSKS
jgi:outer membrane protein assembly factor BamB